MKIILKVNADDNDRIEVWNSSGCLIAILHVDDLFLSNTNKYLRENLYREYEMEYKLEEIDIDG